MNFYRLRELGHHPAISICNNTRPLEQYFLANLNLRVAIPATPLPAELLNWVLCLDAAVTDVVRGEVAIYGLFVSGKLKRLLQNFNLPPHSFFRGSLTQQVHSYHAGNLIREDHIDEDYYLLHLPNLPTKHTLYDFQRSEFYTGWDGQQSCQGPVKFKSFTRQVMQTARIDLFKDIYDGTIKPAGHSNAKLYLTEEAYQYDLIPLPTFDQYYYVSERLQQALTEQQITGCELLEAPWIQRA